MYSTGKNFYFHVTGCTVRSYGGYIHPKNVDLIRLGIRAARYDTTNVE